MSIETKVKCDHSGYCSAKETIKEAFADGWWEIKKNCDSTTFEKISGEYSITIRRLDGLHEAWPEAKHSCASHLSSVVEDMVASFSDGIPTVKGEQ